MPKPRSAAADFAAYAALRGAVALLQALPTRASIAAADGFARLAHRLDKRHRNIARDNIARAFPELAPRQVDRLALECFRHFALLIVEIAVLPRKIHVDNWRKRAFMTNPADIVGPLLSRRPTLVVTAHFGNWELAGYALGALGFRTYAIARVLDNPHVERFLKSFRQRTGQEIVAKKDDFGRLTELLQSGAKVATLGDQDAGPRGVFVPFFGRPASAHKAVALLALEYDAEMVVVGVPRVGAFLEYEIRAADRIDPRDYAGRPDAVQAITARYHAALETLIRAHPEQYFWLHRRWKTRPRGEVAGG